MSKTMTNRDRTALRGGRGITTNGHGKLVDRNNKPVSKIPMGPVEWPVFIVRRKQRIFNPRLPNGRRCCTNPDKPAFVADQKTAAPLYGMVSYTVQCSSAALASRIADMHVHNVAYDFGAHNNPYDEDEFPPHRLLGGSDFEILFDVPAEHGGTS